MSTIPLARSAAGERGGVDRFVEVDRADDQRALRRVGDERRRELRAPRPSRRGAPRSCASGRPRSRGRRPRASTRSARRAGSASPAPACCRSAPCASSRSPSAARGTRAASDHRRRRAPRSALDRGRAEQRKPEPAVGAEGLLGGEVVDVGLARRRAAGRRRPRCASIRTSESSEPGGALDLDHDPGRGLVVGPGDHVGSRVGRRLGRVARLGVDDDRVGEKRRGRGRLRELGRELAVARDAADARGPATPRPPPRTRSCRRCRARPRSRRAATSRSAIPPRTLATTSRTGSWRCEVPISSLCSASLASASGRTFEGPQPNLPSAGLSSVGDACRGRRPSDGEAYGIAWFPRGRYSLTAVAPGYPEGAGVYPLTLLEEIHVPSQLRSRHTLRAKPAHGFSATSRRSRS